ncbi:MAG: hypothetical protein IT384_15380 [Deltaproteobacteria bacterium]|nr:hypothetical protein [Deltaproteobacteria bacterium]
MSMRHRHWWAEPLAMHGITPTIQPFDRGSAAEVLVAFLEAFRRDSSARMVTIPGSALIEDEPGLAAAIERATRLLLDEGRSILLATRPAVAGPGHDWFMPIERPGEPLPVALRCVRQPSPAECRELFGSGALWSSGILISTPVGMLRLFRESQPLLLRSAIAALSGSQEPSPSHLASFLAGLEPAGLDFTAHVLAQRPELLRLLTLPHGIVADLSADLAVRSVAAEASAKAHPVRDDELARRRARTTIRAPARA